MQSLVATKKENQELLARIVKKPENISRFSSILGSPDKANQFLASLTSAVNGNEKLKECNPMQIVGCAMIAASLNLDINPNLGFASIVPYKDKSGKQIPQFQMGWKGFVQLAQRTGQYKSMNVTEVYADEFDGYDPFKGELKYHIVIGGDRDNDRADKIVGYAFYFELTSGYSKMTYMSKEKIESHAKKYSQAYRYDLAKGTQMSTWSSNFDAMAEKTIVKNTLSKFGVLSTQMMLATKVDQATANLTSDTQKEPDISYPDTDMEEQDAIEQTNTENKKAEVSETVPPETEGEPTESDPDLTF